MALTCIFLRRGAPAARCAASQVRATFALFSHRRSTVATTTITQFLVAMGCNTSKVATINNGAKKPAAGSDMANDDDEEYVEGVVCRASDIGENEMRAFTIAEVGRVLVVRQRGAFTAIGGKCTHYGAPLETGALADGRVRCPWHGACFSITTGDIEDFPGVDSLPCFKVDVVDGDVKVRGKVSEMRTSRRQQIPMEMVSTENGEHVVIVGGGPSGNSCAETLRLKGFHGRITMLCKEAHLPYDRVKVSKQLTATGEQLQLRPVDFYAAHAIQVRRGVAVRSLNTAAHLVHLEDGSEVAYTKLYIATGSAAARPANRGADHLAGIFTVRNVDDSMKLNAALTAAGRPNVVVVGASFIAMEVAAACVSQAASVTVIGRGAVPFGKLLGERIGEAVQRLFEAKGVRFVMKSGVEEFVGDAGGHQVHQVRLTNGDVIAADVVVLGMGSTLNTTFVEGSGVRTHPDGAIDVDEHLQTNIENVFAGGDVAKAPVWAADERKVAIGHFGLSQYHGRIAGLNLAGVPTRLRTVPFFWTMLFGKGIRYCGYADDFDDVVYEGDVEALHYAAYFLKDDVVTAVSTCVMRGAAEFANRIYGGRKLYRKDLEPDRTAWMNAEKTSL